MPDQLTMSTALHTSVQSSAGPLAGLIASPEASANAPVILLVPGYTGSKEDFVPLLDPLVQAGFVAVAIDQPGQYESRGPDDEAAYLPAALGPVIGSVVTEFALDHPVVLLGHSFGGLSARAAVIGGAPVSGLVLLCSGPAAFVSGNRFDALTKGQPLLREHGKLALYEASARAAGQDPDDAAPLAQFFRRRFLASSEPGLLSMGRALLTEPDLTPELAVAMARRGIPAAVIAGEADDAWPLEEQRTMARALGTDLVLIPGAAHSPAVESPENLLAVLVPLIRSWLA
jgi:pimeloyl-ACP methyl ester carboxylesterase